jgi:hypothetical protein
MTMDALSLYSAWLADLRAFDKDSDGIDDDLAGFVEPRRSAITQLLARIHANPNPDVSVRFLILSRMDTPNHYVQCAFDDGDSRMLCEAASGYFAEPNTGPWFTPEQKQALADLGFSMDEPKENFRRFVEFPAGLDLDAVADLLLKALYLGYGVRKTTMVEVEAPLAMKRGLLARNRCISRAGIFEDESDQESGERGE